MHYSAIYLYQFLMVNEKMYKHLPLTSVKFIGLSLKIMSRQSCQRVNHWKQKTLINNDTEEKQYAPKETLFGESIYDTA